MIRATMMTIITLMVICGALNLATAASPTLAACEPTYTYSEWVRIGEEQWIEGPWVMRQIYYGRVKTSSCDGSTAQEIKTEGPFQLHQATPHAHIIDVNNPLGPLTGLDGAPLNVKDLPEGAAAPPVPPGFDNVAAAKAEKDQLEQGGWHRFWRGMINSVKNAVMGADRVELAKGVAASLLMSGAAAAIPGVGWVLLGVGAAGVVKAAANAYHARREEQVLAGVGPQVFPTVGVAIMDVVGVSGLVEGASRKRLLTQAPLDAETAGESFANGLLQTTSLVVGGRGKGRPGLGLAQTGRGKVTGKAPKIKTVEDVLQGATQGRTTKGRSSQFEKPGGFNQALDDFDSMELTGVRAIPDGKVGKLPDGRTANVCSKSSDGRSTLEIYDGKKSIKIRYLD